MKILELKTKVVDEKNYKDIDVSKYAEDIKVDEAKLESSLRKFRGQFAETIIAENIIYRDIVSFTSKSECPRFNKSHATVRVGLGLMTKDFENQLIGLENGERKTIQVGEYAVDIIIENVKREILPELNDELVHRCGMEGFTVVEDIIEYCIAEQLAEEMEELTEEVVSYIGRKMVDQSKFIVDSEEEKAVYDDMAQRFESMLGNVDEDSIDDVAKRQILENIQPSSCYMIRLASIAEKHQKEAGKQLTEEDYKSYIMKRAQATERAIEDSEKEESPLLYLIQEYTDGFLEELENYALKMLVKLGRKRTK